MKTQNFYLAGMILITAALLAAPGAAMGEIIDHNQVTYLNNTPLNLPADANYAARSDSNSESADQLADGVAVPGGTTHVDPNLVFWQEDRSANPAYPDPGWDDGVDDAVWDGGYYPNTTFNLGAVYTNLASIQMWYGGWNGAGIGGPVGIKVSFSLDDATYSTPALYNSAPAGYPKDLSFSYHTTTEAIGFEDLGGFQYVNIEWQPVDDGTTQTGMLTMGEVTFDGTPADLPPVFNYGDANGDGVVSAGDYAAVQAAFGTVYTTSGASTPEPATICMLAIGGLLAVRRRCNK